MPERRIHLDSVSDAHVFAIELHRERAVFRDLGDLREPFSNRRNVEHEA